MAIRFCIHLAIAVFASFLGTAATSVAQGPPPPAPLTPLQPPPVPAGNPITIGKTALGKALFWDEQLSSTRTISCGTCHQPLTGGADPRSQLGNPASTNPGPDGTLGTADDITGSPGVVLSNADGTYSLNDFFGMAIQVTGRYAPPSINAGYADSLFWDGRAGDQFRDPITNAVVLDSNAALESQAAGPPNSNAEMGHLGRNWNDVSVRVRGSKPLALADGISSDLADWIANRNYPELFEEVFGSTEITPARIIMAIATYERTLVSNQAPIDAFINGDNNALTLQQQQGLQIFNGQGRCFVCHRGNRFTDDDFHYIGLRPQNEDLGRFNVTGANQDRGAMKTPTLRNVSLRNEFMHNGQFGTLAEVVDFYNRGGDFNANNKPRIIAPLGLNGGQRAALVAFLESLTDPRVAAESAPFDRPSMYADSGRQATLDGASVVGSGDFTLQMVAIEPPLRGNPNFTLGVAGGLGGARAVLAIAEAPLPSNPQAIDESTLRLRYDLVLDGNGPGNGFASIPVAIPGDPAFAGKTFHARWYVTDPNAANGLATSEGATFTIFGESAGLVPAPPSFTATDGEFGSRVDLSWAPVANAISYEVYRGLTSDIGTAARIGNTGGTRFSDTEATPNQVFHYFVLAVTDTEAGLAAGDTGFGSDAAPTLTVQLTASDGSRTDAVALSWTPVDSTTTYRIFRADADEFSQAVEIGSTSATSFLDATAEPGTSFFYWVKFEIGSDIEGLSASDFGFRAVEPSPPASLEAPGFLTATGDQSDAISFSWNSVEGATEYLVYRSTNGDSGSANQITTTSATTIHDTTAAFDQILFYWVQARRSSDGAVSDLAGPVTGWRPEIATPPPGGGGGRDHSGILTPNEVAAAPAETATDYSADLAGRWWGLIQESEVPDGNVALTGCASAMISHLNRANIGVATLVITYEGNNYRLRATPTPHGNVTGGFTKRDEARSEMTLSLKFVDTPRGRKLVGNLSGDGTTSHLELCQRSLHPRQNPSEAAGSYTLVLPADPSFDPAQLPAGDGSAFGRVALNGVGRFLGWLGDGTPTSFTAVSGPDGELMFYRSLYGGKARGWIGGKLTFRDLAGISDADGVLHWVKNADLRQRRYPDGFDLQQGAVASRYEVPDPKNGMPFVLDSLNDGSANAQLSLNGADLATGLDRESLDWTRGNRFRFDIDHFRIVGRAIPRTGWFVGVCVDLETNTRLPFRGVAFQKQQLITGTLRNAESTGFISVEAAGN
ncbi:MAG: hypothetical protein KDN20_24435 [Verrucomicrobiae bacterium]|nr:hypothetical protein [Verrucomicrobiae bacterium]